MRSAVCAACSGDRIAVVIFRRQQHVVAHQRQRHAQQTPDVPDHARGEADQHRRDDGKDQEEPKH